MKKPSKEGLYKCTWSDGGTFYNYFNGTDWCRGMSTLHGEQNALGRIGAALLRGDTDLHIISPMQMSEDDERHLESYELIVDLTGVPDER